MDTVQYQTFNISNFFRFYCALDPCRIQDSNMQVRTWEETHWGTGKNNWSLSLRTFMKTKENSYDFTAAIAYRFSFVSIYILAFLSMETANSSYYYCTLKFTSILIWKIKLAIYKIYWIVSEKNWSNIRNIYIWYTIERQNKFNQTLYNIKMH